MTSNPTLGTVAASGSSGHHGRMRGERDFEAYATARGAAVVRGLLLLGLDLPEAEDTAAAALAFAAFRLA